MIRERMERRSFLKRLGVSVAAVALAPSIVQGLAALVRRAPSSGYEVWNVGYLDTLTTDTVHSLSTSTCPEWLAGPGTLFGIDPRAVEKMKLRDVLETVVPEYALMPVYGEKVAVGGYEASITL